MLSENVLVQFIMRCRLRR